MARDQEDSGEKPQKGEKKGKRAFVEFKMREDLAREIERAANNGELRSSGVASARIVGAEESPEESAATNASDQVNKRKWMDSEDSRRSISPNDSDSPPKR